MKQLFFALLPTILLVACSTNPDGSVNWSDNPLNKVATKVDNGVQKLNHNTDKVIAKTGGGDRFGNHCVTCDDKGVSYKQMLEWGYIRRNPDYPKYSSQRYVFTSRNCDKTRQSLCFRPSKDIAERP